MVRSRGLAVLRAIAALGVIAMIGTATYYVLNLFGILLPLRWLAAPGVVLFATALIYILRFHVTREADVHFRWWMPAIWIALIINTAIVWYLADRATQGGTIEQRGANSVLAVHGHVIRTLDAEGIRAVELWNAREISSHLLLMLSFVSVGLVALTRNAPATTGRPQPNADVARLV